MNKLLISILILISLNLLGSSHAERIDVLIQNIETNTELGNTLPEEAVKYFEALKTYSVNSYVDGRIDDNLIDLTLDQIQSAGFPSNLQERIHATIMSQGESLNDTPISQIPLFILLHPIITGTNPNDTFKATERKANVRAIALLDLTTSALIAINPYAEIDDSTHIMIEYMGGDKNKFIDLMLTYDLGIVHIPASDGSGIFVHMTVGTPNFNAIANLTLDGTIARVNESMESKVKTNVIESGKLTTEVTSMSSTLISNPVDILEIIGNVTFYSPVGIEDATKDILVFQELLIDYSDISNIQIFTYPSGLYDQFVKQDAARGRIPLQAYYYNYKYDNRDLNSYTTYEIFSSLFQIYNTRFLIGKATINGDEMYVALFVNEYNSGASIKLSLIKQAAEEAEQQRQRAIVMAQEQRQREEQQRQREAEQAEQQRQREAKQAERQREEEEYQERLAVARTKALGKTTPIKFPFLGKREIQSVLGIKAIQHSNPLLNNSYSVYAAMFAWQQFDQAIALTADQKANGNWTVESVKSGNNKRMIASYRNGSTDLTIMIDYEVSGSYVSIGNIWTDVSMFMDGQEMKAEELYLLISDTTGSQIEAPLYLYGDLSQNEIKNLVRELIIHRPLYIESHDEELVRREYKVD